MLRARSVRRDQRQTDTVSQSRVKISYFNLKSQSVMDMLVILAMYVDVGKDDYIHVKRQLKKSSFAV